MRCCQCQKELPEGARFCKYCGAKQQMTEEQVPQPVTVYPPGNEAARAAETGGPQPAAPEQKNAPVPEQPEVSIEEAELPEEGHPVFFKRGNAEPEAGPAEDVAEPIEPTVQEALPGSAEEPESSREAMEEAGTALPEMQPAEPPEEPDPSIEKSGLEEAEATEAQERRAEIVSEMPDLLPEEVPEQAEELFVARPEAERSAEGMAGEEPTAWMVKDLPEEPRAAAPAPETVPFWEGLDAVLASADLRQEPRREEPVFDIDQALEAAGQMTPAESGMAVGREREIHPAQESAVATAPTAATSSSEPEREMAAQESLPEDRTVPVGGPETPAGSASRFRVEKKQKQREEKRREGRAVSRESVQQPGKEEKRRRSISPGAVLWRLMVIAVEAAAIVYLCLRLF